MVCCRRGNNRATSHRHKNKWSSDCNCQMKNSHHSKAVFEQKEINHSFKVSSPQQKERRNTGYRHNKKQSMQRIECKKKPKESQPEKQELFQILMTILTPSPLASLTQQPKHVLPALPTTAFSPTLAHQARASNCSSPVPLQSRTTVSSPR
jgi:hypothetical protein